MEIRSKRTGKRLVIELEGRLDTNTAPKLKTLLEDEVKDVKELVFHLEQLDYMSSAGLAIFISAIKQMKEQNGVIMVCGANERVMAGFKMTGLSTRLNFQNTEKTEENGGKKND